MKEIIIDINADGTSKVESFGFKGSSCTLATRELEVALAGNMSNVDDRKKPDFFAQNVGTNKTTL